MIFPNFNGPWWGYFPDSCVITTSARCCGRASHQSTRHPMGGTGRSWKTYLKMFGCWRFGLLSCFIPKSSFCYCTCSSFLTKASELDVGLLWPLRSVLAEHAVWYGQHSTAKATICRETTIKPSDFRAKFQTSPKQLCTSLLWSIQIQQSTQHLQSTSGKIFKHQTPTKDVEHLPIRQISGTSSEMSTRFSTLFPFLFYHEARRTLLLATISPTATDLLHSINSLLQVTQMSGCPKRRGESHESWFLMHKFTQFTKFTIVIMLS